MASSFWWKRGEICKVFVTPQEKKTEMSLFSSTPQVHGTMISGPWFQRSCEKEFSYNWEEEVGVLGSECYVLKCRKGPPLHTSNCLRKTNALMWHFVLWRLRQQNSHVMYVRPCVALGSRLSWPAAAAAAVAGAAMSATTTTTATSRGRGHD